MRIRSRFTFLWTDLSTLWKRGMQARSWALIFLFGKIWNLVLFLRNGHSISSNYCWKWFCWNSLVIQYRISLQTTSSELAPMRKNSELLSDGVCCQNERLEELTVLRVGVQGHVSQMLLVSMLHHSPHPFISYCHQQHQSQEIGWDED